MNRNSLHRSCPDAPHMQNIYLDCSEVGRRRKLQLATLSSFYSYKDEDCLFRCWAVIESFISGDVWESACPPTESPADSWLKAQGPAIQLPGNMVHTLLLQDCLKVAGVFYSDLGWIQSRRGISLAVMANSQSCLHC